MGGKRKTARLGLAKVGAKKRRIEQRGRDGIGAIEAGTFDSHRGGKKKGPTVFIRSPKEGTPREKQRKNCNSTKTRLNMKEVGDKL